MDILVIGSGGREHAIIYGLKRSPGADKIYALPGNGGINREAEQVNIDANNFPEIAQFCKSNNISLVVIGPEIPLVAGIVDYLEECGIKVFGPRKAAARLEGSKDFMKIIAKKYDIPTAEYESFTDEYSAKKYIKKKGVPIVIKADGLAAGKGVIIAQEEQEAFDAIDEMFAGKFGAAGKKVVIEEFLQGEEASFFAICDGKTAIALGSAQDHKRVGDGDKGPNTGGMGTYSPTPIITGNIHNRIMKEIILPTMEGMKKEGVPYKGILFAGLMIDKNGPKLLEFNVRFGDPETQVLIPRLKTDLLSVILAACNGELDKIQIHLSNKTALCVVMAANGYPDEYQKGTRINNLDEAAILEDVIIFHAGTKYEGKQYYANGGRVLGITALGNNILTAQKKAYQAVDMIDWSEGFCRRDIGWRAIEMAKKGGL